MKINKRSFRHLISLTAFGLNVLTALLLRPLRKRKDRKTVVLYGHKLSGNLLAIYEYWLTKARGEADMVYLTMDKTYHRELQRDGINTVLATNVPACIALLSRADAVVSSHGLHVIAWMVRHSDIKFYDVWHGIPFKGFDGDDFRLQHRFNETWVTSPLLANLYVQRFGFDQDKVKVTGYSRTDRLVKPTQEKRTVRKRFGLQPGGKIVLFAPTWQQDAKQRSIYPFGIPENVFLDYLEALAQRCKATIIIRAHLNSHEGSGATRSRILYRSFADYPDTEALMLACDVLVCDWSSIAFDWLLLQRPTVFLDVPAPFAKGFSLGPEYRFDHIAQEMDSMLRHLEHALSGAGQENRQPTKQQLLVREAIYAEYADGQASKRCVQRLLAQLLSNESSR
jgi:CDP-glycerol glycerophosphotransferase (TagB/SpsB family)